MAKCKYAKIKYCISKFVGLILLIFMGPLLLLTAVVIFIVDGSPVFFFQKRIGKNLKSFYIIKFRTMKKKANGPYFTKKYDKRLTSLGKFLRKLSIDELPQLINIICDDMGFIGPRPDLPAQVKILKKQDAILRHKILPGITGLSQVTGRSSLNYKQRLTRDLFYAKNYNYIMDIWILFKTFASILKFKDTV